MKNTAEADIIEYFLGIITQVKLFHWATMSYAKHVALDKLHGSLSDKIDSFVESYIGKFKKQPLKSFTIHAKAVSDTNGIDKFLEVTLEQLSSLHKSFEKEKAPELANIIEEMMSEIDTTMYLCRLS